MADIENLVYRLGTPVVIGAGAGVLAYFTEEALVHEINSRRWVLPVLAGFAAAGAAYILMK